MVDKRLIATVKESRTCIALHVAIQWVSLAANIGMIAAICRLLERLYLKKATGYDLLVCGAIVAGAALIRFLCSRGAAHMGYLSSRAVKQRLRSMIYQKLLRLGASYNRHIQTSEVVQVAVEGVEQLETYFGAYLPQFFYAMLAPVTLFAVMCMINLPSAVVLLACVPLIPVSIAAVQTWAKKLLSRYWGRYTALGDTFLENLQGLTTLKIYRADAFKREEMQKEAEMFRRVTMKVLTMQLNSITIMDVIAYGGAAAGIALAASQMQAGRIGPGGALMLMLLAADYFIPMRLLGSFFHIAMNGMAASEKIFRLLDMQETEEKTKAVPADCSIRLQNLCFSYEADRPVLRGVDMTFPMGSFTAIVGESGCGKSTVAALLMGRNKGYEGVASVGGVPLKDIGEKSLMENFTYISHQSYLFKGTVRENLLMGAPQASDEELWRALESANLAGFLRGGEGLDMRLQERASNLSGGQRQRLALARALLHDSPVYIFDEATSNIDVESENDMMALIRALAKTKTVIMISHRLANTVEADQIYVMEGGRVAEHGRHDRLLEQGGRYAALWAAQQQLEQYGKKQAS